MHASQHYCALPSTRWGGAIELFILSKHYRKEIAAYDIQTKRCDIYGQDQGGWEGGGEAGGACMCVSQGHGQLGGEKARGGRGGAQAGIHSQRAGEGETTQGAHVCI